MERYLLGKTNALRNVVLAEWRRAKRRGKAHGSVELILKQFRPEDLEDSNQDPDLCLCILYLNIYIYNMYMMYVFYLKRVFVSFIMIHAFL